MICGESLKTNQKEVPNKESERGYVPSHNAIETKTTTFNTNQYFIMHPSNVICENMEVIKIIRERGYPPTKLPSS